MILLLLLLIAFLTPFQLEMLGFRKVFQRFLDPFFYAFYYRGFTTKINSIVVLPLCQNTYRGFTALFRGFTTIHFVVSPPSISWFHHHRVFSKQAVPMPRGSFFFTKSFFKSVFKSKRSLSAFLFFKN